MLKLAATLIFSLSSFFTLLGQSVNNIPIKDLEVEYIEITGNYKLFKGKVTIDIDFGQRDKGLNTKDRKVLDENGKNIFFNSMVDALNFMSKNGYEFVQAYTVASENTSTIYYLMKKSKGDKIISGWEKDKPK